MVSSIDTNRAESSTLVRFPHHLCLTRAKDIEHLSRLISQILSNIGFTTYTFSFLGNAAYLEKGALTTSPVEMRSIYFKYGFYEHDAAVQYLASNCEPVFRTLINGYVDSSPYLTEFSSRNKELINFVQSYDLNDFFLIPTGFDKYPGALIVSTLKSPIIDFHRNIINHREELVSLTNLIRDIGINKFYGRFLVENLYENKYVLKEETLQILHLMAKGYGNKSEISKKMNISRATFYKHLLDGQQKLGANTPEHLLAIAISKGVIQI